MKNENTYTIPMAIVVAGVLLSGSIFYSSKNVQSDAKEVSLPVSVLEQTVLPTAGVELPVSWGDLGSQLVQSGAVDEAKFKSIYENRGKFTQEYSRLLEGNNTGKLKITKENSGYLLNLFWALGLANKNPILEEGEMMDPRYGGAQNFASTGGWTMAQGNPMNHYSKHKFFNLTIEQQALVDKVSRGIYRPCCGNSTHFPDCNHGMAMLGLLELMASQGASEQEMWKTALVVNSYWFPNTYMTIATYMKSVKGVKWENVNPQEILGANYSSAQGYARIASQVTLPSSPQNAGGCGVDTDTSAVAPAPRQQSGCGI